MTDLTDRYLGAALDGVPRAKRSDVERELRSSIADAIDDRTAMGEDPARAEVEVLEGLGDPGILGSRLAGGVPWIVGPEIYPVWRRLMVMLLPVGLAIVGVVQAVLAIVNESSAGEIILQTAGSVLMVGVQIVFWVTLVFAAWERIASAEEIRKDLGIATGRWTVDRLPVPTSGRMSASDLVGELVTNILCLVGLLVLTQVHITEDGVQVPLLTTEFRTFWVPVIAATLVLQAILQIGVYARGRWTTRLAALNAVVGIAFAAPVVVLALQGRIVDPAFGVAIGFPQLGAADGITMILVAIGVTLVSAWDILDAFRRARIARSAAITG
jgi:hypothetical protein